PPSSSGCCCVRPRSPGPAARRRPARGRPLPGARRARAARARLLPPPDAPASCGGVDCAAQGALVAMPPSSHAACGPLEPCVRAARAAPHLAGELVGEAQALLGDRLRDRGAAGDLLDEQPQLLALEQ